MNDEFGLGVGSNYITTTFLHVLHSDHFFYRFFFTSYRSNGPVVHPIQLGHHDLVLDTTYLPAATEVAT